jgi:hypothetical protein
MIVMSALCYDDSGGLCLAPIGQLTCMTAIFNTVHQYPRVMSVASSHQRPAPRRNLGTERVMCLALPVNVNHVLILSNPIPSHHCGSSVG